MSQPAQQDICINQKQHLFHVSLKIWIDFTADQHTNQLPVHIFAKRPI
jgi:hypothetical protein